MSDQKRDGNVVTQANGIRKSPMSNAAEKFTTCRIRFQKEQSAIKSLDATAIHRTYHACLILRRLKVKTKRLSIVFVLITTLATRAVFEKIKGD